MSFQEIEEYLVGLEHEVKEFKKELFRISWYMRGGITVNDLLYNYGYDDREAAYAIINENIENTKNAQMPLI